MPGASPFQEGQLTPTNLAGSAPLAPGEYLPVLDGWRAVAILMVMLFHSCYTSDFGSFRYIDALNIITGRLGALGVLVFFCISGFLITSKMISESTPAAPFSARDFYLKRLFRICPPLAVYLLVLVLLFSLHLIQLQPRDWAAPVFLTDYVGGSWYTFHFWSLSVEEHFYIVWPVCILLAGWRRSLWVGLGLVVVVGIWRAWQLHRLALSTGALDHFYASRMLQHTDMRIDYIMMGCCVALAVTLFVPARHLLRRLGGTAWLLALFVLLVLSTRALHFDTHSLQALLLTLMVCASAHSHSHLVRALLANRLMIAIGRISYSLYIWQELFFGPTQSAFLSSPKGLFIKVPATFVAAYLSYRFVERPCIRYGRRFLHHRRSRIETLPA